MDSYNKAFFLCLRRFSLLAAKLMRALPFSSIAGGDQFIRRIHELIAQVGSIVIILFPISDMNAANAIQATDLSGKSAWIRWRDFLLWPSGWTSLQRKLRSGK